MVEGELLLAVESMLNDLREDPSNSRSAPLFKKVIANSVPIWTAVEQTPSVCFYLADTTYEDTDGLRYKGTSSLVIYVYNKHRTRGLSLKDILTKYIDAIRAEVNKLSKIEGNILNAFVSKTSRDGGTILPYTVAEMSVNIDFIEAKAC